MERGKIAIEQHSDVLWTQWLWTYFTGQRGSRLIPEDRERVSGREPRHAGSLTPHARRRESGADGHLYVIQDNCANDREYDRRDAGGDKTEHCRLLPCVVVQGRIPHFVISSACRFRKWLSAELPFSLHTGRGVYPRIIEHSMLKRRTCVSP